MALPVLLLIDAIYGKAASILERINILQAQFPFLILSNCTLLDKIFSFLLQLNSRSQRYKLSRASLWKCYWWFIDSFDTKLFKKTRLEFYKRVWSKDKQKKNINILSLCHPVLFLNPILWSSVTRAKQSRCVWLRLGWLFGEFVFATLINCSTRILLLIETYRCLHMPEVMNNPLSFLLNILPTLRPCPFQKTSSWFVQWSVICHILPKLGCLSHHDESSSQSLQLEQRLLII